MEQLLNQNNDSFDQNGADSNERRGGRKRAITGVQGYYRGADGKMYQRG